MLEFHQKLMQLLQAGEACATATLVESVGSTPGKQGHRMIVLPDRSIHFTIGGGPLEAMVIDDCVGLLARGRNAVKEYDLIPSGSNAVGMVCGGRVRVFIEVHPAASRLLVFGAGHVGAAVIRMARGMGFARAVADDRMEFLQRLADSGADTVHCPEGYRGELPDTGSGTHVVIVTRCHETDREILARLASRPLAYLGMIGSRRKVETILRELEERGIPRRQLAHLRAPIGLPIGARTPREIAVSILAELLAVRSGADVSSRRGQGKREAG